MPHEPKPAMPHIIGSTTPCTSAQAMPASTALPPSRRASAPASVASGCGATIIAFLLYRTLFPPLRPFPSPPLGGEVRRGGIENRGSPPLLASPPVGERNMKGKTQSQPLRLRNAALSGASASPFAERPGSHSPSACTVAG